MGTRHLICIYIDGECKLAQYGQWDGYPEGQGSDIVKFLQQKDFSLDFFKERAKAITLYSEEEITKTIETNANWHNDYPWLSRDFGSDILDYVYNTNARVANNDPVFSADSLFCEWAYVIDLDAEMLEVYRGFQKEPHTKGRFCKGAQQHTGYYPVALVIAFPLTDIPEDWLKQINVLTNRDE